MPTEVYNLAKMANGWLVESSAVLAALNSHYKYRPLPSMLLATITSVRKKEITASALLGMVIDIVPTNVEWRVGVAGDGRAWAVAYPSPGEHKANNHCHTAGSPAMALLCAIEALGEESCAC